ncbi:hypothetical protein BDV98DRAFT_208672 [Pterulicium gracile]|uniref:Secreted protein n=1 Tax=Pterulicium gracile TaxID=1884261 RepID=A0A5C3Q9Q2_9AGAR|nr:hypothetical protein BDV98DRAFT_208672 [Pterula gracilis]
MNSTTALTIAILWNSCWTKYPQSAQAQYLQSVYFCHDHGADLGWVYGPPAASASKFNGASPPLFFITYPIGHDRGRLSSAQVQRTRTHAPRVL